MFVSITTTLCMQFQTSFAEGNTSFKMIQIWYYRLFYFWDTETSFLCYYWTDLSGSFFKLEVNFLLNSTALKLTLTWHFHPSWATDFFRDGVWCKCPVHTWIHLDQKKRNQSHEPWWGGLYFLSHVYEPQKSDAEKEVTLKKSVAHDRRNLQVIVNFSLVLFWRKFTSNSKSFLCISKYFFIYQKHLRCSSS